MSKSLKTCSTTMYVIYTFWTTDIRNGTYYYLSKCTNVITYFLLLDKLASLHACCTCFETLLFFFLSTNLSNHLNLRLMHFSIINILRGVMRFMYFLDVLYFVLRLITPLRVLAIEKCINSKL